MDKDSYIQALEREKAARKEVERVLEEKVVELFETNQKLNKLLEIRTEALNSTEERYRNIFDSAFDAIVILDNVGSIVDFNKKFIEITKYEEEEIKQLSIGSLVHPEDAEKFHNYSVQLLDKGFYKDCRGRIIAKDQTIVHIEINSIALYDDNNCISGSIDVVRDVTDRIVVEEKLFESGERFKALFDNSSLGIVINKFDGKIIRANAFMEKLLGYKKYELKGVSIKTLTHKEDMSTTKEYISNILSGTIDNFRIEKRYVQKSGNIKWGNTFCTLIKDRDGNPSYLLALIEDITDWKLSHNLLEQNEEKWRFVIENMELSLIEVDKNGIVTKAYDRFCELTGYSREELIGKNPIPMLVKDQESLDVFDKNMAIRGKGVESNYELKITKKNGEKAWLLISGSPLKNEKQEVIGSIGIHLDITDRKKMLVDLENAKLLAEDSSKAKENFLANMSHEIRTPMNAIMGMTRLLKDSLNENDKEKYLDAIESSSENLLVIINDILDISKIEANKLELEKIPFRLSKVLGDLNQLLSYKTEEKGVLLNFEVPQDFHDNLIGDPVRLSQIITNLVNNGIKFTQKGSVNCLVSIIDETDKDITLKFIIKDSGIGISQEKLTSIFESFTQEDQTVARKFGGTGLGLSITKRLIELHNSEIFVTSKKGKGTSFEFKLTYSKGVILDKDKKEGLKKINLNMVKGAHVLLVEDHPINTLLAETILTNWGMKVTHVENGKLAVEAVKNNSFDIILMDMQMPVMDGITATKIIKSEVDQVTPIIALTANAIKGDEKKCLEAGMNAYVSKPIDPSDLFNKIITHLNHGK